MIFSRKFTLAENDDYENLAAASGRLRALLEGYAGGSLPLEYGRKQLARYAESLLAVQRLDGSFAAFSEPEKLEADVRTDIHRFVTWAALAFLCRFQDDGGFNSPELNQDLKDGIITAMRSSVSVDLSFPESGEAEPVQQVEAVFILSSGGIPGRIKADPTLSPGLKAALDSLAAGFSSRIDSGDTSLPGGIDYEDLFKQALTDLES